MINPKFITTSVQHGKEYSRSHNMRKYKEAHIDPDGKFYVIVDVEPKEYLQEEFKKAIDEYNQRQQRKERRKDLKEFVENNAKKVRELIVMVGNYENKLPEEVAYDILKKYADKWQEHNPNMKLIGCYLHFDERGGYHGHFDYLPIGYCYEKGLEKRVSLNKALEEMAFTAGADKDGKYSYAIVKWQDAQRKIIDQICEAHGVKVHHPEIEHREHMKIQEYKLLMELKNLQQEIGEAKKTMDMLKTVIEEMKLTASIENYQIEEVKEAVAERMQDVEHSVTLTKREYNDLLKSAMAYESVLDMYTDRGERMIEMYEIVSDYKHSLEKMEKTVEKLEEYEEILANTPVEDGISALEAFEKKKKAEKKKAEKELAKKNAKESQDK